MPTYQYACVDCDGQLEAVQRFTDEPLRECPTCGGKLRKVFSPVGVVFKGSGFYRNDSRSGQGSGRTVKADAKSGDGKSGSSSDSKSGDSGGSSESSSGGAKAGVGSSSSGSSGGSSGSSGGSKGSSSGKSESAA